MNSMTVSERRNWAEVATHDHSVTDRIGPSINEFNLYKGTSTYEQMRWPNLLRKDLDHGKPGRTITKLRGGVVLIGEF